MGGKGIPLFTYRSQNLGTHLLVLGAMHGDEVCGTIGTARLRLELDAGLVELTGGQLTLAPVCNPSAYQAGKRFINANLNRIVGRHAHPQHEEHHYAGLVAELIESADVVLDLHSYASGGAPFLFLDDPTAESRSLAAAQGIANWVTGWPELYSNDTQDPLDSDTISYARAHGKKGLVVECGRHDDPATITVAYDCARNTLHYLGMMAAVAKAKPQPVPTISRVEKIVRRDRTGGFAHDWQHLQEVTAGQPLINYADGQVLGAPFDGVVMLPNEHAELGHEWLYLGRFAPIA